MKITKRNKKILYVTLIIFMLYIIYRTLNSNIVIKEGMTKQEKKDKKEQCKKERKEKRKQDKHQAQCDKLLAKKK